MEGSVSRDQRESDPSERFFQQRRALLFLGAAGLLNFFLPFSGSSFSEIPEETQSIFRDLAHIEPLEEPLLVFRNYEDDSDQEIKSYIIQSLASNPRFFEEIKERTGASKPPVLNFERLEIKLLFVPERRENYTEAYAEYCAKAIDYSLEKTKLEDPQLRILTPREAYPDTSREGTKAFLVHQLGKEYRATCTFTGEEGHSVKYQLEGAIVSNHIGAVALNIECPESGVFLLRRRNYSIWQNRTKNLYKLLSIPVEETLHFILGKYTDRKIGEVLGKRPDWKVIEVQSLAEHWMAIEEAVVGGIVHALLPGFLKGIGIQIPASEIQRSIKSEEGLHRYRFRGSGIDLAKELGYRHVIGLFKTDPGALGELLSESCNHPPGCRFLDSSA